MGSQRSLPYIPALDGLRALAILPVMLFHADVAIFKGGYVGVDIFFVLSGYLITTLMLREFNESGRVDLRRFYWRRVLRLGPALIALLILFSLMSALLLPSGEAFDNLVESGIALAYMSNWARALGWHPMQYLGHTWSLSIEEQFYLIWPLALLLILRRSSNRHSVARCAITVALIAWATRILLTAGGSPPMHLYNRTDLRADALMIGCALAALLSTRNPQSLCADRPAVFVIATPISLICLGFIMTSIEWYEPFLYYIGMAVVECCTAVLLVDVLCNPASLIRRALSARWLAWIGSISYGLYLYHFPIFFAMNKTNHQDLVLPIGLPLTFAVAALSHRFLEMPIQHRGRNFRLVR